jgi:RNA polymerase sigma-70 factor (ECF subfamily)
VTVVESFPEEEIAMPPTAEPEELDDVRCLRASAGGDFAGLASLYDRYGTRMKSIARNLTGTTEDAEDAVQETFLKAHRSASGFRGASKVSTWLYRLLENTCHDLLRKRRRRGEVDILSDDGTLPPSRDPAADHALRLLLQRSLSRIGARPRTAFLLYAVEGFTHREIGEILEISENGSKSLLFEARRQLTPLLLEGTAGRRTP